MPDYRQFLGTDRRAFPHVGDGCNTADAAAADQPVVREGPATYGGLAEAAPLGPHDGFFGTFQPTGIGLAGGVAM